MPIYEFRCNGCQRRTSVFTRSIGSPVTALCEHCGSSDLTRLISRVAVLRSDEDFFGADESGLADVDESDPRSVARWMRRMSRQMGEPLEPEMETEIDRMEAGEMPDDFGDGDDADDAFAEE